MGVTEDADMDMIFLDLLIHVLVVHSPNALFVSVELRVNDLTAVVGNGTGEADVSRRVDQDGLTRSGESRAESKPQRRRKRRPERRSRNR